jgi:hypothetical protein
MLLPIDTHIKHYVHYSSHTSIYDLFTDSPSYFRFCNAEPSIGSYKQETVLFEVRRCGTWSPAELRI